MILVPIKNLEGAKQRLSPVLGVEERRALAAAMMEDVLETLASWGGRPPVAVVTSDAKAMDWAHSYGFEIIAEPETRSETDAIDLATRVVVERGCKSTLVIPADIPLITVHELQTIVTAAPNEGTVLVPAADGRGTNAVLRRPAALFPLRFGNDSFLPHRRCAEDTGKAVVVLELPGVALDVDRPADLAELLARAGDRRSQRLLRAWSIAERLEAARIA
ncbi:MAG: 2-phospho-L-lactate guanylyltransferase [Acidobacteria bacterium]|nr:2-phospho-L-lactate guanylyltransferase [Acidobacteriota bacterium]